MKVVFWGAGKYAERVMNTIKKDVDTYRDEYEIIVDNNRARKGESFNGLKVIAPDQLQNYEYDIIVITSIYEKEIHEQISRDIHIAEERIYSWNEYAGLYLVRQIYKSRYENEISDKKKNIFNLKKIVVYTAITGKYDSLKEPLFQNEDIDYICFTNNPELKSNIWKIREIQDRDRDNVHLARHIKINPHIYCPEYETSVWVDGKFQIRSDIRKYIAQYQSDAKMLCFPHFERQCIIDEAAMCTILHKGDKKDMFNQVADYLKAGYPVDNGLYETGCIVRIHNDSEIVELMRMWEEEVNRYSVRDQLSFPYVCWKKDFVPDICDLLIYKNNWLAAYPHTEN